MRTAAKSHRRWHRVRHRRAYPPPFEEPDCRLCRLTPTRHARTTDMTHEFFAPAASEERVFSLRQQFDYEGLAGRLWSSSYVPLEGHPSYAPMMQELQRIFRAHAKDDTVEFEYKTRVFYGHL